MTNLEINKDWTKKRKTEEKRMTEQKEKDWRKENDRRTNARKSKK